MIGSELLPVDHLIQIYFQTVCKFANRHRHTAGSEVVAAFNHSGDLTSAEQSLQISLHRRISLLDLSTGGQDRFFCMLLG